MLIKDLRLIKNYCIKQMKTNWNFSFFGGSKPEILSREVRGSSYSLARAVVGKRVSLVGFQGKDGMNRLLGMGLNPGAQLQVISSQPSGSVLVAIQDNRIALGAGMAANILVKDEVVETENRIHLGEMPIGTVGRVLGYENILRGYKGKLLSMGLTPGTEFKVIRVAPLGDPIEISVRGFHLSLRKQEADALVVAEVGRQG
jgi:ferrous iron transport protein A